MRYTKYYSVVAMTAVAGVMLAVSPSYAASSSSLDILRSGLLGAGTGAIASEVSGGNAGKGALIGAGTQVIGGALLGFLTDSAVSNRQAVYSQPVYATPPQTQPQLVYGPQTVYQPQPVYSTEPVYIRQAAPVYSYSQPQTNSNTQIIKQGILGAGTGAIAASASGGKAGKGALIGAGTNVIGGALLDLLTGSAQ